MNKVGAVSSTLDAPDARAANVKQAFFLSIFIPISTIFSYNTIFHNIYNTPSLCCPFRSSCSRATAFQTTGKFGIKQIWFLEHKEGDSGAVAFRSNTGRYLAVHDEDNGRVDGSGEKVRL